MQLGVAVGIPGHLKQGVEDVVQQLLKILNDALLLVHIVQAWQLQCTTQQVSVCSAGCQSSERYQHT